MIRTPAEVKAEFERKGVSISAWAVANGFSSNLVHEILRDPTRGKRGQSHRIAIALGLKEGEIVTDVAHALDRCAA